MHPRNVSVFTTRTSAPAIPRLRLARRRPLPPRWRILPGGPKSGQPAGRALRAPGLLARLAAVDRLRLSPEGFAPRHHRRLTEHLLQLGVRAFVWSFHTPSLEPGHTPYVRSEAELDAFLGRFSAYFEFFLGELGGVARTPFELKEALAQAG